MRAFTANGFEEREVANPLGVLVRVRYAAICKTDALVFAGAVKSTPGVVLGHEFCGTVVEAPPGMGLEPGLLVTANPMLPVRHLGGGVPYPGTGEAMLGLSADGAFAEYVSLPPESVAPCPPAGGREWLCALTEPVAVALGAAEALFEAAGPTGRAGALKDDRFTRLVKACYDRMAGEYRPMTIGEPPYDALLGDPDDLSMAAVKDGGAVVVRSRSPKPCALTPNTLAMRRIRLLGSRYAHEMFNGAARYAVFHPEVGADCEIHPFDELPELIGRAYRDANRKFIVKVCSE